MLLQIQKPGLRYAASRADWLLRFGRTVKQDARPLLILWPFAPVALVYDQMDTEGPDLPAHVSAFPAKGIMTEAGLNSFVAKIAKSGITTTFIDAGDNRAGSIVRTRAGDSPKAKSAYSIKINRNHNSNTQFATLAHELGHLCLGHQGADKFLKIPERSDLHFDQKEIEAESVAYLVCSRIGIECRSESYLANYIQDHETIDKVDHYQVMRAAGAVEGILGLSSQDPNHWQVQVGAISPSGDSQSSSAHDIAQQQVESILSNANVAQLLGDSLVSSNETEAAIQALSADFGDEFVKMIRIVAGQRATEVVQELLSKIASTSDQKMS
jgi:hypothetical protein